MNIPILILAAGASSRMRGGDKLLEDVTGMPCLQVMATRALATGQPVLVTLPSVDHPRTRCLADLNVKVVEVPDAYLGMSHSLQRGIVALPHTAEGVMILPADMPDITTQDMNEMLTAFSNTDALALRAATETGSQGHPIIFDASLLVEFQYLSGDIGAQSILSKLGKNLALHPLKGDRARLDLDTPDDWSSWRAHSESVRS
jgi:molybdenum cofactor cytidylyltransferase|tara:strand:+ start:4316 stop:4921 length:606 start_codon:yes stop_codon:yes gene_type:complete